MWKFFRKFIKKIKGPWPETSTGARMNPRTSLICGGLALVVMGLAAARVTYSLYDIQIKNGDTYRQLAAKQQLLDTTIKATRGEIYDTSGITLASTSVVWTIWADPDNSKILYTTTGKDEEAVRTLDTAMCAEVSRELTLRLLSGDGESLDAVDTSSEAYQTQYQKVYDALSKMDTKYQVLATKVNNAVKLSIESYVSQFNKAHKRATETSRKGNISVGSEKSFQRNTPTERLQRQCWALPMRTALVLTVWKNPISPRWPVWMAAPLPSAMPTATPLRTRMPPPLQPRMAPIWCFRWM